MTARRVIGSRCGFLNNMKLLGNAKQSPFIDPRPLANPNVPEIREYCIMPTLANVEVGQRSEILSIKYSG